MLNFFKSFTGGIHPEEEKDLTENKPIKKSAVPKIVTIPLIQHTGVPCEPLVNVGDEVKLGQPIGDTQRFITAPIHAAIAGKVVKIEDLPHPNGSNVKSIVIEGDSEEALHPTIKPYPELSQLSKEDIRRIVRAAGIVGLGGGAFPTHVKLDPPHDKHIEYYVLNGAECEPYLTNDNRIMIERSQDVLYGLKTMMKPADAEYGIIAIEDNKPKAIEAMKKAVEGEKKIQVRVLRTKYPQGGEKQLIKSLLCREIPSGGLPMDVKVAVNNVGTAAAVAAAIKTGMPLIERVVTVTGKSLKNPSNLLARIGTPIRQLIDECGGLPANTRKVIIGGPMTGVAQWNLDVPVVKGMTGILILKKDETDEAEAETCVRCARCVDACPARILPNFLGDYSEAGRYDRCEEFNAKDCIECGICSYICPTRRNLMQLIKLAKLELVKKKK
jgi:electron transport complex protein RnfC